MNSSEEYQVTDFAADQGCLDNKWVYDLLGRIHYEYPLDLTDWCGPMLGARWQSMPERYWVDAPRKEEWLKLLSKVPRSFRRELEYINNFVLDAISHIVPNFDTILSNHAYMEWLLYHNLDHEKYREHIVHPVKVAAIAQWLLTKSNRMDQVISNLDNAKHVQYCLAKLNMAKSFFRSGTDRKKIIRGALWLAGLCHDLGYGHNFFCQLEKRMLESYRFYSADAAAGSIAGFDPRLLLQSLLPYHLMDEADLNNCWALDSMTNRDSMSPKEGWKLRSYENFACNHSIAGALNLLCLLQEVVEYWPKINPKLILTFELAAEAILLHDLTKEANFSPPRGRGAFINFQQTPLAVILVLADEIQDWGRPRLKYYPSSEADKIIVKHDCRNQEIPYLWDGPDKRGIKTLRIPAEIVANIENLGTVGFGRKRFSHENFVIIKSLL